jgi:hypothetical protein
LWQTHLDTPLKSGVKRLYANKESFAALKTDGTAIAWGNPINGGDFGTPTEAALQFSYIAFKPVVYNFARLFSNSFAFVGVTVVPLTVKIEGITEGEAVRGGFTRSFTLTTSEKPDGFVLSEDVKMEPADCGKVGWKSTSEDKTTYSLIFTPTAPKSQKCTLVVPANSFSAFEDLKNEEKKLTFFIDLVPGKPTVAIEGINENAIVSGERNVTFRISEDVPENGGDLEKPENAFTSSDVVVQPVGSILKHQLGGISKIFFSRFFFSR